MTTWVKSSFSLNNATCVEVAWTKSSYCGTNGCVEVAWRKSTHSSGGNCVEVAGSDGAILVRDSKDPDGPHLRFSRAEWSAFLAGAKAREFD